jgi:small subunit ribosomal protein S17
VESRYAHPIYKKTLKTSKRFLAHDELNECNLGDQVVISETRPMSRNKRWMIKEILKKTLLSN